MIITSPKTEHHVGGGKRTIPIFPSFRGYLEEVRNQAQAGDDYVFPQEWRERAHGAKGWQNVNLRTTFEKIIKRAGVVKWTRLFHSLRASCETDLASRYPLATVVKWLGNTQAIALTHYVDASDAEFTRALTDNTATTSIAATTQTPIATPHEMASGIFGNELPRKVLPSEICASENGVENTIKNTPENHSFYLPTKLPTFTPKITKNDTFDENVMCHKNSSETHFFSTQNPPERRARDSKRIQKHRKT